MKIGLVGATGLVGSKMLEVLAESGLEIDELVPVASERSLGKTVIFKGKEYNIITPDMALLRTDVDAYLFSAGGSTSLTYAPQFADKGIYIIDNSSAWRMAKDVPLIVPEVNAHVLKQENHIIANPNCSTIQLVMVLAPLDKQYGLSRVVVSTYQSVTGTGVKAVEQLHAEREGRDVERVYPHQIDKNVLPHIDVFLDNGYTKEEMKVVLESRKILGLNDLAITCTAVRVPVVGGHSESVNIALNNPFQLDDIRTLLSAQSGIVVMDNPSQNIYPMPILSHDKDDVFVGRIRYDESITNGLNMWIVSDNLRKGAATNAVQILQHIVAKGWVK